MIPNGEQCVEFWYYSNGNILSSASALSVYVRTQTQPSNSTGFLIWSKRTELVNIFIPKQNTHQNLGSFSFLGWAMAHFSTTYSAWSQFDTVSIDITRFNLQSGTDSPAIAIDDVFIRDRACLSGGDCDFENG
jgi:hypothetical protein